jgi:ATP-dependent Clp protease ATP-binding subunit ClpA
VGKSELGKALAPALEQCCGRRCSLVWTELNTFTEPHSVHRLTGAPPGYVGYEDQPVFEAVRQNPFTVFMFDELEKAHPEVLKVFMSILDEGRCTARKADEQGGRELDFRRCVFVFTTNADLTAAGGRPLGFSQDRPDTRKRPPEKAPVGPAELAERLFRENEEARRAMVRLGVLPEIAGRFSGIIGLQALDEEARRAVTAKQVAALGREYGLNVVRVAPETLRALTPSGSLSIRSSVCVLESLLAPLLAAAGRTAYRLTGQPGNLRLVPDYSQSSSTTLLTLSSSL